MEIASPTGGQKIEMSPKTLRWVPLYRVRMEGINFLIEKDQSYSVHIFAMADDPRGETFVEKNQVTAFSFHHKVNGRHTRSSLLVCDVASCQISSDAYLCLMDSDAVDVHRRSYKYQIFVCSIFLCLWDFSS